MNIYIYEYNIYICQRERSENIHTINVWDAIMAQDPMREQKGLFAVRHDQRVRELPVKRVPIELLYPEQGSICSQVISRRAHFSLRESGACVLVAGPSEQLIEDAKDQSAHHRKDARRQRRFAHHAVYLQ